MNIKNLNRELKTKQKELDELVRRKLPVIVGRMAKSHYQENFRRSGFVNDGLHAWPPVKRRNSGDDAASRNKPLLSGRNLLYGSRKYVPSDYRVKVSNDVIYAPVHNWGATLKPTVTPKMRKYAWYRYYKASPKKKGEKGKRKGSLQVSENSEAAKWKGLALTKKTKLSVKIPQRQFLGQSKELDDAIRKEIDKRTNNILNV